MTSLPMTIGLLLLALSAGGLLWARRGGEETRRIASRYLEPLCTWCLVAVAIVTFVRLASGDVGMWLCLPLALATVALWLLTAPATSGAAHPAEVAPAQVPAPEATAPTAPLWAGRPDEDSARRAGLWRRA